MKLYPMIVLFFIAMATPAIAEDNLTWTAGVTSDYVARGTSQTLNEPAWNVGVNYDNDGWYAGLLVNTAWGYYEWRKAMLAKAV